jgi:hypothetical protein
MAVAPRRSWPGCAHEPERRAWRSLSYRRFGSGRLLPTSSDPAASGQSQISASASSTTGSRPTSVARDRRTPRHFVTCPYANSVVEFQLRRSIGTQRQVARSISFGRNRQHLRTHRAAQGGADRDAAPPVVRAAGSGASRRRRRAAHPSAHGCMRWRRPGRPFQHSRTNGCRLRSPTCFSLPKGSGRLRPKRLCDKSGGW